VATPTKTARTLQASTSNSAGATTTTSTWDLRTTFGGTITGKVTNGGTGPTVACTMIVDTSHDGTNWYERERVLCDATNSAITEWNHDLPIGIMYARMRFTGNTGQAVTVESYGQEATSIA
jgi:hypothetical protein